MSTNAKHIAGSLGINLSELLASTSAEANWCRKNRSLKHQHSIFLYALAYIFLNRQHENDIVASMLSHEVDLTFSHGALRFMSREVATMWEGTQMSMSIQLPLQIE